MSDDARLDAPSVTRNREPILAALRPYLPARGLVLEVASGTGQHVAYLAAALPGLAWQPSDPLAERRASIDAWTAGLANVRPALALDASAAAWPIAQADAVICINMLHIAPWAATLGLMAGAAQVLPSGGRLAVYGAFRHAGQAITPSNALFDAELRETDEAWGLRLLEDVATVASAAGFGAADIKHLPANNLLVVWQRV